MPKTLAVTLALLSLWSLPATAQEGTDPAAGSAVDAAVDDYDARTRLPETVVTVTRGPRSVFEVPRAVTVIDEETLREQMPAQLVKSMTMRDAAVLMDMRTWTTGDPIMRGFAGFNLLALVDGNTLSTLWGEGGDGADDMYGKIDPDTIERIEIVRGPESVLYGSNALGGVFNFITRSSPIDYTDAGFAGGGRIRTTYTSVNGGLRGRFEGWGATPDVKFLAGYTRANYDDGRRGGDGKVLSPTGGKESNFDVRGDWAFLPGNELSLTLQNVTRWNLGRYYRPFQSNRNERLGIGAAWKSEELFDGVRNFNWRLYYQKKRDERSWSDTGKEGFAETDTFSTDLAASSDLGGGHYLTYGVHAHRDDGQSPDDEQFTYTAPPPTLADAPDSEWSNLAAFLQDEWRVAETVTLTLSGRYDYFRFRSMDTAEYKPGDANRGEDFFTDSTGALTGGLGASFAIAPEWRILASYSHGFHQIAPAFGLVQKGLGVQVPSGLLDPITSDNFEVGARCRYPAFQAEGFVYYTMAKDWADYRRGTWNGQDWYDFNRNGSRDANEDVFTYQNVDSAHLEGVELKATVFLPQAIDGFPAGWSVWGGFAYNQGKLDGGDEFRHTQPARGLIGIRWDDSDPDRAAYFELVTEMVAKYDRISDTRKQEDLAYREDPQNPSLGPLRSYGGVPGFVVFNAYAGMNLCESARLNLGIENIGDVKYRRAHSRMDAFGLNVVVGLDITF